ncbi:hypothetical protein [Streptomyces sp. NPDC058665]|uniref:hypothetical protein n=1 Tax=Streptomyces sp. NPDC058665 TaxID=3346586 RepID=UPI003664887F
MAPSVTRALGQVPAAAAAVIKAELLAHLNADDTPRLTEADATAAARAVVLALQADGWHITAPPPRQRP